MLPAEILFYALEKSASNIIPALFYVSVKHQPETMHIIIKKWLHVSCINKIKKNNAAPKNMLTQIGDYQPKKIFTLLDI